MLKDILGGKFHMRYNQGKIEENGFIFDSNLPNRKFQFRFHNLPSVIAPKLLYERKSYLHGSSKSPW